MVRCERIRPAPDSSVTCDLPNWQGNKLGLHARRCGAPSFNTLFASSLTMGQEGRLRGEACAAFCEVYTLPGRTAPGFVRSQRSPCPVRLRLHRNSLCMAYIFSRSEEPEADEIGLRPSANYESWRAPPSWGGPAQHDCARQEKPARYEEIAG